MDDDIIVRMEAEAQALAAKLEAVHQFLAVYRDGLAKPAKSTTPAIIDAVAAEAGLVRNAKDRLDKFGPYGHRIVNAVASILPGDGSNPVATRKLVAQLDYLDVEITGENKVNSLSALLARSSKIKGYGRAGWTLKSAEHGERYPLNMDNTVHHENAPPSEFEELLDEAEIAPDAQYGGPQE
ncbi:hypothetical protein [Sphingomonas mollis]|uniref:Uncharacterized protein n=1 Tax=Sphingomonas mollis TaxID=2795726 RepID=A0ABS0XRP0_9SPHN|nr:hypothetical protein [Sphingomonas sp. BT553]MBJ6122722.1 hypothetical protein [Sphingomonas sp. BT553]